MNGIHEDEEKILANGNILVTCKKCGRKVEVQNVLQRELLNMAGCKF